MNSPVLNTPTPTNRSGPSASIAPETGRYPRAWKTAALTLAVVVALLAAAVGFESYTLYHSAGTERRAGRPGYDRPDPGRRRGAVARLAPTPAAGGHRYRLVLGPAEPPASGNGPSVKQHAEPVPG